MDILFKKGIPGFNGYKEYELKELEESSICKMLQCKEDLELGLIIISPFEVEEDYEIKLSDELIKKLEITSPEDVMLYTTVTLNSDINKITTNLRAPIIININKGLGEQIIVENESYKIKHPIIKG
ncbi:flagellar assembly protein FliW [Clostridium sp. LP20]|uniref:flagellar assembly protein FliW n=1 Tax=Clostridium sp. LP20 TaxID=3418665 RepID=UPI003EE52A5D